MWPPPDGHLTCSPVMGTELPVFTVQAPVKGKGSRAPGGGNLGDHSRILLTTVRSLVLDYLRPSQVQNAATLQKFPRASPECHQLKSKLEIGARLLGVVPGVPLRGRSFPPSVATWNQRDVLCSQHTTARQAQNSRCRYPWFKKLRKRRIKLCLPVAGRSQTR